MAQQVKYKLTQTIGSCRCFTFEDITGSISETNPNGYGAPNTNVEDVIETKIFITDRKGNRYYVNRNYLPSKGPITICGQDLVSDDLASVSESSVLDEDCGCPQTTEPVFVPPYPISNPCANTKLIDCNEPTDGPVIRDGCVLIEYYVFANTNKQKQCTYSIQRTFTLQSDQTLWALKNGQLVDITDKIISGSVAIYASADVYTKWFVKKSDRVEFCGEFTTSSCVIETLPTTSKTLVSYAIEKLILLCNTETKISNATYKVNIDTDGCSGHNAQITFEQQNYLLAMAWSKFYALKNDPGCNCICVENTIEQIDKIIDKLTNKNTCG